MAKLFSLNIERSKHLHRWLPYVRALAPDILCLQEVVTPDLQQIRDATGLDHCHHVEMAIHPDGNQPFGVAILARHPFTDTKTVVYAGDSNGQQLFDRTTDETKIATCRYVLPVAHVKIGETDFTVTTTHFPWTPDGEPRPFQTAAAESLVSKLGTGPVILTGDFNAPRGGPIFAALAARWRDNIPALAKTSIDPDLHRAGALQLMVDGLFTSPEFTASDVRLVPGLSDHQGVSAMIARHVSA